MSRKAAIADSTVAKIAVAEYVKVLLPLNLDTRSLYYWARLSVIHAAMSAQGYDNWCTVRFKTHYLSKKIDERSDKVIDDYILRAVKLYQESEQGSDANKQLNAVIVGEIREKPAADIPEPLGTFTWDVGENIRLLKQTKTMRERLTLAIREFRGNMLFAKADPMNLAGEMFSDTPTKFAEKMGLLLSNK